MIIMVIVTTVLMIVKLVQDRMYMIVWYVLVDIIMMELDVDHVMEDVKNVMDLIQMIVLLVQVNIHI